VRGNTVLLRQLLHSHVWSPNTRRYGKRQYGDVTARNHQRLSSSTIRCQTNTAWTGQKHEYARRQQFNNSCYLLIIIITSARGYCDLSCLLVGWLVRWLTSGHQLHWLAKCRTEIWSTTKRTKAGKCRTKSHRCMGIFRGALRLGPPFGGEKNGTNI